MEVLLERSDEQRHLPLGAVHSEQASLATALTAKGMEHHDAALKMPLFKRAAAALLLQQKLPPEAPATVLWVPGRVELAGKHTDYCGGRSLLCAAPRGFGAVCCDRDDNLLRIASRAGVATLPLTADTSVPSADWSCYPAAVARRLARNFGDNLLGVDLAIESDLPEASGMSSSSALVCLTFIALARRNSLASHPIFASAGLGVPEHLCHYLGCIENGSSCGESLPGDAGVGTFGGSEDHTAIMCCEAQRLRVYSFCPTRLEADTPFCTSLRLVIAASGALARKTAERMQDYNCATVLAKQAAAAALGALGAEAGSTSLLSDAVELASRQLCVPRDDPRVLHRLLQALEPTGRDELRCRLAQFLFESESVVPGLSEALSTEDDSRLSTLAEQSHGQAAVGLRNTVDETDWLPERARELGALGASAFGAGFGGSVWAVVREADAARLRDEWRRLYLAKFPERGEQADFFVMQPAPGACCLAR